MAQAVRGRARGHDVIDQQNMPAGQVHGCLERARDVVMPLGPAQARLGPGIPDLAQTAKKGSDADDLAKHARQLGALVEAPVKHPCGQHGHGHDAVGTGQTVPVPSLPDQVAQQQPQTVIVIELVLMDEIAQGTGVGAMKSHSRPRRLAQTAGEA